MLNVTEASAVNDLLDWLLSKDKPYLGPVTDEQATKAARLLADRANAKLMAGLAGSDVPGLSRRDVATRLRRTAATLEVRQHA